ncbi:MAG: MmgE/PrpD family protein [Solirubrobacterales bacterium]|nr:MmgE/PrpD family protein [Solirubrobacterales bacterium]
MSTAAYTLAAWATAFEPAQDDLALAERALRDTLAVLYASRRHPLRYLFEQLPDVGRWAAHAHVLDFDDLHLPSTTHISAVCVPVALASGGDARAYLAGAGVMARLGTALGWGHYTAGWHATCTAGAPAAAVTAAVAGELDAVPTAAAIALAVPAAGGVQRAFGTSAKALQVGFAADAGMRAARLAAEGATADPGALDDWIGLVGGDRSALPASDDGETIPGGLAIKLYPCCYALQRPIAALLDLNPLPPADQVTAIRVATPESGLKPLIHARPRTGLEGKFSLEYAIAATLLDGRPNQVSFTDAAVQRPAAQRLVDLVEVTPTAQGNGLLDGKVEIEISLHDREPAIARIDLPPGAPQRPPSDRELRRKLEACAGPAAAELAEVTWATARSFLEEHGL